MVEKESRVNKCLNKFFFRSNLDKARRLYKYKQTNGAWLSWTLLGRFLGSQSTGKSWYFVKNLRQTRFRCHFWHNLLFIAHVCIAITWTLNSAAVSYSAAKPQKSFCSYSSLDIIVIRIILAKPLYWILLDDHNAECEQLYSIVITWSSLQGPWGCIKLNDIIPWCELSWRYDGF